MGHHLAHHRAPNGILRARCGARFERHPQSILRLCGGSSGTCRAPRRSTFRLFCGCGASSKISFRAICGSKAGPRCRFEPERSFRAASSSHKGSCRARAAISSASPKPKPSKAREASFERPGTAERARPGDSSSFQTLLEFS